MDRKQQIAELVKKGFNKSQAAIMCMHKESMQQGGALNPKANEYTISSQRPIKFIQPVSTEGYRDNGRLAPGDYQKVYYVDPRNAKVENQDYEYLTDSGYDELRRMNNYRIYREQLNKTQPQQLAAMQEGGYVQQGNEYYNVNSPYFMQNPGVNQNVPAPIRLEKPENYNFEIEPIPQNKNYTYTEPSDEQLYQQSGYRMPGSTPAASTDTKFSKDLRKEFNRIDYINSDAPQYTPFQGGNDNVSLGLRTLGQGLGEKDGWKTMRGAGLATIAGARNFLGGYGAGKENRRVEDEYRNELFKDNRQSITLQEGGEIKTSEVLTGKFAVNNPNGGNVNVENNEFIKHNQTNEIQKAVGKGHENGGINTNIEDGKVLSDYTKIGAKNAKELKERYNLSLKATDTFAKAMDKANKKLGVNEAIEEQAEAIEGIGKNETVKDATTKRLNETVLVKEVQEYEDKLQQLKGAQNFVFEDIFKRQEAKGKIGDGQTLLDKNGKPMEVKEQPVAQQGGKFESLAKKYGISPERAQQLMQEGGQTQQEQISPEQIITAFAEATQQDPNTIMQQLQQMPQEEQQQALEAMMQQLQGGQEAMQQGGKIYAQEGYSFSTRATPKLAGYETDGTSILNQDVLSGVEEFQPYTGKGYGAKMEDVEKTINTHSWYFDTDKKKNDFRAAVVKEGRQPEVAAFQEAYNKELEKRAEKVGIPKTEIEGIKKQVGFSDKGVEKVDGLFGAFTSTRPLYNFSKKDGEIKIEAKTPEYNYGETATQQAPQVAPDNTFGFTPYITPPSPRQGVILETATPPQYERAKRSFEAGQASLENQLEARRQQLAASGLNPMQQEALMANEAANTQEATNRNIASVEQFNAQSKADTANRQEDANFKTNLFNASQRDQYFVRNTAAKDAQEIAQKQYNDAYNKLGYRTQQDNFNKSLVNASADNFRVNNNGSLTFLPPQVGDSSPDNTAYWEAFTKLTPQEQVAETKRLSAEKLARINAEKKQKALQNRK